MKNEENTIVTNFKDQNVRILDKHGEAWFIAVDVCRVLNIKDSHKALQLLEKDEKGVAIMHTLGGPQKMNIINESGLYVLIMKSRKQEARDFRIWVTHEVLPQIRKTGSYNPQNNDAVPRLINIITRLLMDRAEQESELHYLRQFHPNGTLGEPSERTGMPRSFYRKAAYVSRHGRNLHSQDSYRQLDLFRDLPILQEAKNILASCNNRSLLQ